MPPAHVKEGGTFREVSEIHVKEGGTWREAQEGWVKENGVWRQFHSKAEPIITTVQFGVQQWTQTYRPTGQQSGGSNRNDLNYAGVDGWNSQNEIGMSGIYDWAAIQAAFTAKPTVVGTVEVHWWVGYKRSSTPGRAFVRFHDGSPTVRPASLPGIYGTELDSNFSTEIPWTRPGSTGEAADATGTEAFGQTFVDGVVAGTIGGVVTTSDTDGDRNQWGWYMGDQRSRSNSGGSSGSMIDTQPGEVYVPRFIITHQ